MWPQWMLWLAGADDQSQRMQARIVTRTRSVEQVDAELSVERSIWIRERRDGDECPAAQASKRRINALLEERKRAMAL